MDAVVFLLVLGAALLHATWNMLVKSDGDQLAVMLHVSYKLFLFKSYQHGDLSHVYPMARGLSPLIVALLSVVVVGETLSPASHIGVMCIGIGLISLAFTRGLQVRGERRVARMAI